MSNSLFERLDGNAGITAITNDLVEDHLTNAAIASRFANSDVPTMKSAAASFMIAGTGGENKYKGNDMLSTHWVSVACYRVWGRGMVASIFESSRALFHKIPCLIIVQRHWGGASNGNLGIGRSGVLN